MHVHIYSHSVKMCRTPYSSVPMCLSIQLISGNKENEETRLNDWESRHWFIATSPSLLYCFIVTSHSSKPLLYCIIATSNPGTPRWTCRCFIVTFPSSSPSYFVLLKLPTWVPPWLVDLLWQLPTYLVPPVLFNATSH